MDMRALINAATTLFEASDLPIGFRPIRNPSKAALGAALSRLKEPSEGLRALISENGDVFAWDAYYANHDEAEGALGLSGTLSLHLYTHHPELDADTFDDETELAAAIKRVRANPVLQRLYGQDFDFEVEQGYDVRWASQIEGG